VKNAALTSMEAQEFCLIITSQHEKKKRRRVSWAVVNAAPSGEAARAKGSLASITHPLLGCWGDRQQAGNWRQLSWGAGDADAPTISIFHRSHLKALPLQESGTRNCL